MMEMRTLKIVDKTKKTVDADAAVEGKWMEEGLPWKMIIFIDS
jgi:hypothetical protein